MKAQISKTWAIHPGSKQPGFLADKALKTSKKRVAESFEIEVR